MNFEGLQNYKRYKSVSGASYGFSVGPTMNSPNRGRYTVINRWKQNRSASPVAKRMKFTRSRYKPKHQYWRTRRYKRRPWRVYKKYYKYL